MACILLRSCPHLLYPFEDELLDYTIRLSIFLIYAECTGAAALLWALSVLHRHRKHKGRIPAFVIIVLFNNLLELLLNPYIITKLIQGECNFYTCHALFTLWGATVTYGVLLQQMMVLESVLDLRHPSCSANVFFIPCSIIFCIIAFVCVFLSKLFGLSLLLLIVILPLVSIKMVSWIVVCRKPPNENIFNRTKKPDCTLLAFATTTLIIYIISLIPFIFRNVGPHDSTIFQIMNLCLLSLRVMVDPLLCVLVCKQKTAVDAEQSV